MNFVFNTFFEYFNVKLENKIIFIFNLFFSNALFYFKFFIPLFLKDFITMFRYTAQLINFLKTHFSTFFNEFEFIQIFYNFFKTISNLIYIFPFFFYVDYVSFKLFIINFYNYFSVKSSSQSHHYKSFNNLFTEIFFYENTNNRFLKFNNPIYKYDYKSGDYFPKFYKETYWFLFSSLLNITSAIKPNN